MNRCSLVHPVHHRAASTGVGCVLFTGDTERSAFETLEAGGPMVRRGTTTGLKHHITGTSGARATRSGRAVALVGGPPVDVQDRSGPWREAAAMRPPVDLEIVVPAYNEAARLPATLRAMTAFLARQPWTSRIVVVDNGSADDTAAAVRPVEQTEVEVVVIGCARPGKGAAVHRGLRTSQARVVGFTDADLSTPLATLVPALDALNRGAVAAIASRRAPGAQVAVAQPLGRRLGGAAFRALSRSMIPDVHDTQCGFKFFDRVAVQDALTRCRSTGFAFDVELLHAVRHGGGRIVELPVVWTDHHGTSLRPVRDGVAAFAAVARLHHDLATLPLRRRDRRTDLRLPTELAS